MFSYFFARVFIYSLWLVRWTLGADGKTYLILFAPQLQQFLSFVGKVRAFAVFERARRECPAYREFLNAENYEQRNGWRLENVPVMTKENYVKKYTIEERCYGGAIPVPGTVIDESSGSSGVPNNWVRSLSERKDVKRVLQLNYEIIYQEKCCILLNCFALGPWATGMNVSMSLADVGILKSIGPDAKKLENTLQLFGAKYRYLIFGYPPFLKAWLEQTELDLSLYRIDAVVGGEGMSEGLRSYFLKSFNTVISSYGASDLEINIGVETEMTIALRRLCFQNRGLSLKLFGRETPPMIFQYNAADYIIETNADGELLFTITRLEGAAPKIRYNLRDLGGCLSYEDLSAKLKSEGFEIKDFAKKQGAFPILFVHGRNDLSVPFYGSKIFPHDLEEIINTNPLLIGRINSFQLKSEETADLKRILKIHLEKTRAPREDLRDLEKLREIIFDELCRVNQDFREVSRIFDRSQVEVYLHDFETDMFAGRDIRIKNKYIG
ncbi:MAG: CoF synthetase [Acidobacteriota bacterium]|nr:CoF synthetase [Acidobacteriota bacterium]